MSRPIISLCIYASICLSGRSTGQPSGNIILERLSAPKIPPKLLPADLSQSAGASSSLVGSELMFLLYKNPRPAHAAIGEPLPLVEGKNLPEPSGKKKKQV